MFSLKLDLVKRKEIFKGTIVANGFTHKKYAFSLAKFDCLRLVFCLSAMRKWDISQLYTKTAFLNGKLDYIIYLKAPNGTTKNDNLVWNRSSCCLEQSPKMWYLTVKKLVDIGYRKSILKQCLF